MTPSPALLPTDAATQPWGATIPNREGFFQMAANYRSVPIVRRLLAEHLTPTAVYQLVGGDPGTFILESADGGDWGRWSFIGVNSCAHLSSEGDQAEWQGRIPAGLTESGHPLVLIKEAITHLHHPPMPAEYPPFTGGLVGALGWETVRLTENVPARLEKDVPIPDIILALATDIIALDRRTGEVWLIACTLNFDGRDKGAEGAYEQACARLDKMERLLHSPLPALPLRGEGTPSAGDTQRDDIHFSHTPAEFYAAVEAAQEAIAAGEVFQLVLSQRAEMACTVSALSVYRILRTTNPSPYMYLFNLPAGSGETFSIVGSSPETLVEVRQRQVRTFPIAGSRPRGSTATEDRALAEELLADPKERAEHVMLVDLARNDLSRVCAPGSVEVSEYMAIKRYSHIMHITSTVTGQLREDISALDALTSTLPAGTLSGAPKVRAIELIDELEPVRRGIYGGVVGYLDLHGNVDMAIAIRTAVLFQQRAYVQAGAGIVKDSQPQRELDEAHNKAAAALAAVARAHQLQD